MKRLIIGDIHGSGLWKDIYDYEKPNEVVILGDYFDSFTIGPIAQKLNFIDLLDCQLQHGKRKFTLLIGNHELHYLLEDQKYSGYNKETRAYIDRLLRKALDDNCLQLSLLDSVNNIIYSHAGISKDWTTEMCMTEHQIVYQLNNLSLEYFKYFPKDRSGDGTDSRQNPLWIRPNALEKNMIDGYTQIIGHTHIHSPLSKICENGETLINMDCLNCGWYAVEELDNNSYKLKNRKFKNLFSEEAILQYSYKM